MRLLIWWLDKPPTGFTKAVYLKVAIFRDGHVEHEARMIASYDTCRFTDLDTVVPQPGASLPRFH